MTETSPDILINEIMELIPHRIPMLLIDKLTDVKLGESATGIKNVTMNEWFFQGHFPGHPVMPGVLIVEAMAQAAGVLVTKSMSQNSDGKIIYFMSIEEAKFRKPVVPGDTLKLKITLLKSRGNIWKFKGEAWVEDVMTDEATFTAMIASK
ncbi:3-hydroxyacyl-ACP dehydratase FabZ [Candidatus Odyssella acanthamoebae]|uniref:3-hydroxyacyl-[acyl-carrier-protein] dehydratase FabZ n=1 Tax=Candidatus Odyssella acanthamoebae TaxID=91604 RepID=A0A077AVW3_9PROT|nr:3-hydroxyacyl-ACP dehydratase FabZ [Candidatus Paracaedibacter acanthamoebae]AIK95798.1 3-hydroxyacyl-ACP dehydratase [Candidatus Paracaedibacter acanthamoebae]